MTPVFTSSITKNTTWREETILQSIDQIRSLYKEHIDCAWIGGLIHELPLDYETYRAIKTLLDMNQITSRDVITVQRGIKEFKRLINLIDSFLLPEIHRKGNLHLRKDSLTYKDKNQYIIRQFKLYTFPYNLKRLQKLIEELQTFLTLLYPIAG